MITHQYNKLQMLVPCKRAGPFTNPEEAARRMAQSKQNPTTLISVEFSVDHGEGIYLQYRKAFTAPVETATGARTAWILEK